MVVLIPERTVERLCAYRRIIRRWVMQGRQFIQSQELADEADVTSAQVRRDFMSLNTIGIPKKGYATAALLQELGLIIEGEGGQRIVLLGAGNLGSAIVKYLDGMRPDLTIVAAFDTDPAKFGTQVDGVPCLPLTELPVVVRDRNVLMAIIAGESLWRGMGWRMAVLMAISTAVAAVPEGLPAASVGLCT